MFRLVVVLVTLVAAASSASLPSKGDAIGFALDGRIVGGDEADVSLHPHQISLRYKGCDTCAFNHRCGGSIISPKIVLTAAHCVDNLDAKRLHVVAGANQRNGHGTLVPVEKFVVHEDYFTVTSYNNDVAILFLALELNLNNFDIKAVEMATKQPSDGALSVITGWGTTTEGGSPANLLLEVFVPIVSNDKCEEAYGDGKITDTMLCAGTSTGGKDACQGDSGGPLLVDNLLAGIVSWGYGCARPEYPGVYASVPNLKPWIDNVISENL